MKKSLLILLLLATACAPSVNSADSPIEDKTGIAKGHAVLTFHSYYDNAKMTVVTSDGEIFTGTAIVPRSEYSSSTDIFSTRSSSKAEAVLIGNKNHSMKCQLILAEPGYGVTAGAIGECKISDGRVIPVTFNNKR